MFSYQHVFNLVPITWKYPTHSTYSTHSFTIAQSTLQKGDGYFNLAKVTSVLFSMKFLQVCKDTQIANANIKCAQDKTIKNA